QFERREPFWFAWRDLALSGLQPVILQPALHCPDQAAHANAPVWSKILSRAQYASKRSSHASKRTNCPSIVRPRQIQSTSSAGVGLVHGGPGAGDERTGPCTAADQECRADRHGRIALAGNVHRCRPYATQ